MRVLIPVVVVAAFALAGCDPNSSEARNSQTMNSGDAASDAADQQAKADAERLELQKSAWRSCINTTLTADAATGTSTDAARVQAMQAIDTTGCPTEFRTAYFDHIEAWKRAMQVESAWATLNSDDNVKHTLILGWLAGILGVSATPIADHIDAENRLKELRAAASSQIADTYTVVRRVALTYGVDFKG